MRPRSPFAGSVAWEDPPAAADPERPEGEEALAERAGALGIAFLDPRGYPVAPEVLALVPAEAAWRHRLVPLFLLGDSLTVATSDPSDVETQDELQRLTGRQIECALAAPEHIHAALLRLYGEDRSLLLGDAGELDAVRLAQLLVTQAVRQGASDIHIEPLRTELQLRFRVDGTLHRVSAPPLEQHPALVSRLKVLSQLDIAERRRPQDGRLTLEIDGSAVDIRVSTLPTQFGENMVLRILDRRRSVLGLSELGFGAALIAELGELLARPHGIVLVTGPTGSGKTTTLYAGLAGLDALERNITTLEDPIEYELPLVRQSQVEPKAGFGFAEGLRSLLRQDPDIIMVGEIRDLETARIAMQAALTGHLVLSSLHTNDAASAVTRLLDMGVEPYLVASSVSGVLAQRLVRSLCPECRRPAEPSGQARRAFGSALEGGRFFQGPGCASCRGWGHAGRTALGELMVVNEEIAELAVARRPASAIRERAIAAGMRTLGEDGLEKARLGLVSLDEVLRAAVVRPADAP